MGFKQVHYLQIDVLGALHTTLAEYGEENMSRGVSLIHSQSRSSSCRHSIKDPLLRRKGTLCPFAKRFTSKYCCSFLRVRIISEISSRSR